ncbi:MAG TPA: XrtA system polysaccharide deacetylase [Gemmatimonadaceae bacterium]|nr:XrtA system polysaccharide deacetylase [Gemmatimonadaceae bacterium]
MTGHHFTVDVEEYFHASAFESVIDRNHWENLEQRSASGIALLLDLLARHSVHGTFFVLGWVLEHDPDTVRAIAAGGHEIASHGWDHRRVTQQTPHQFRASVRQTKQALEDLTGMPVRGFRAPSFSIVPGKEWALDVLIEEGYTYDSSLMPVWRPDQYGYPSGNPDPHWLSRPAGRLAEIPPATLRRFGVSLPAGGGAYFRVLPYRLVQSALVDCERRSVPGTFYIHPWELDPDQPRIAARWPTRLRHYGGLRRTRPRLERLLGEFRFTTIAQTLEGM